MPVKRKKKRKVRRRAKRKESASDRVIKLFDRFGPDFVKRFEDSASRAVRAEASETLLRDRIVSILSPDQIEAAEIAGCAPEVYALEWIKIILMNHGPTIPTFADNVKSFAELRRL